MASWTELDTNGLLPGEPMTSAKALAFFENPSAIAEGAANAPRVAQKVILPTGTVPDNALDFEAFDGWQGAMITGDFADGSQPNNIQIALGDGTSYATALTIFATSAAFDVGQFTVFALILLLL